MRLKKNEKPLILAEHRQISDMISAFVKAFAIVNPLIEKGFAPASLVNKKLNTMNEIANFLKYSLQQSADMHRKKLEKDSAVPIIGDLTAWQKVYLGDVR